MAYMLIKYKKGRDSYAAAVQVTKQSKNYITHACVNKTIVNRAVGSNF